MKKDITRLICGLIILLSVGLGAYIHFELWPLHSMTYQITYLELLYIWGSRPAFWLCIGIVGASIFFRVQVNHKAANICLWLGSAIVALYCGLLIFYFTGSYVSPLVWISKSTGLFVIPGILIGVFLAGQTQNSYV